jgi:hypothetical protein
MAPGFLLDRGHHNQGKVGQWVEGQPERSFWFGLKLSDRERYPISTMRCERCGFLELYAQPAAVEAG